MEKICERCKKIFNKRRGKFCSYCYIINLKEKNKDDKEWLRTFSLKANEKTRKYYKKVKDRPEVKEKNLLRSRIYYRTKAGIPLDSPRKINLKGEGSITSQGYKIITMKGHPNSQKSGRIFEHIFIMSEFLKRALLKKENVHHKNGIKHDNRIENLELWNNSQPPGQRVEDKIKWAKEFLEQYGYVVLKDEKTPSPI